MGQSEAGVLAWVVLGLEERGLSVIHINLSEGQAILQWTVEYFSAFNLQPPALAPFPAGTTTHYLLPPSLATTSPLPPSSPIT